MPEGELGERKEKTLNAFQVSRNLAAVVHCNNWPVIVAQTRMFSPQTDLDSCATGIKSNRKSFGIDGRSEAALFQKPPRKARTMNMHISMTIAESCTQSLFQEISPTTTSWPYEGQCLYQILGCFEYINTSQQRQSIYLQLSVEFVTVPIKHGQVEWPKV